MPETCIVCLGNLGDGGHDDSVSIEGDNASTTDPPPPMLSVHTDIKGYGLSTVISSGQTSEGTGKGKGKGKGKAKDEADESDPESSMHIAHLLPCGHNMHNECLKPWVERANSCPICRRVFNQVELVAYIGGPVLSSYPVQHRTQPVPADPDPDTDLSLLAQLDNETTSLPPLQTNPCPICRLADNEHVLLLCDGCDAPYHTYCIGLASVPPGAWFCEDCELQRAIALSMQEPLPAARTPTGRRTRGEVRRNRRRRGMERAQWTRVWRGVWNNLGFDGYEHDAVEQHENRSERGEDEEIEFDDGEGEGEGDEYMRDDDIHDNASTYSDDEERQREIEEGTFGFGTPSSPFEMYEIRQQALADRRAEIQADRRAWERRLRVAESQGQNRPTPNGGNASRFADTQHTLLLRQAEHAAQAEERISRNWPRARPLERRVKTPEPQTLEEMRAWELFDRAMAGEDEATSPARTPRGRKRRAEEDEGEKREDGGGTGAGAQENANAQPWRPLKRPRTRRPEQLAAMRNAAAAATGAGAGAGGQASASASASTSTSTSAAAGRSTATPSAPTFLQTLLKEVEESALSPTIIRRPRPATVSRLPRSVIENGRASRSSATRAGVAPTAAHSNSHSGSSSDCSSPRLLHAGGAGGGANGTAATPPTSVSESPFISPSGSPGDTLMTMFSPTEGGDSDVEMGGYQKSPTPIDSRRAAVDRRHRHQQQQQQQQQQPHRHKHRSNQHQHQHHHPSSSSSRTHSSHHHHHHHHQPKSPSSLSYNSKSLLQSYVSAALKPHHRRRTINSSQYTDINRRVSRSLYERAGMDEALLSGESATADAAKRRWEQVAKDLVEAEIRAVFAKKGPRVPIPRATAAAEGDGQGEATATARRTPVVVVADGARQG